MNGSLAPEPATPALAQRLLSLDALRGFDMFWIVGGEELIHALRKTSDAAPIRLLDEQFDHKAWEGFGFYDLIFPLFVFIVGVSLVFSITRTIERAGKRAALKRIVLRSLVLFLIGVFLYGGLAKGLDQVRWLGVLQRIALSYFFTGLIFCAFRLRGMIVMAAALLLGYWAVMTFVPVRDFNLEREHLKQLHAETGITNTASLFHATIPRVTGKFDDGRNLAQHLDFQFLPGRKWDGAYDPEGLLSTLPAIVTCLLGVFAGLWLKNDRISAQRKVFGLLGAGMLGVTLGFVWGLQFPVIKKIWTSSYVLVAGGYSCLLLAVFHQGIEIWGWRRWCTPFVWVGMNPITIYIVYHLVDLRGLAERIAGGPIRASLGRAGELLVAAIGVSLMLLLVRFLYVRKLFLRF